jgi:hypothetical protein
VAGVQTAGEQFIAALQAGDYDAACETFTAKALVSLNKERGGCAGVLPTLYLRLGTQIQKWASVELPKIQVQGDSALSGREVQARYEHGRWHLEDSVL